MLNNHLYNLMLQMTEEHKSLWRIKNEYKKDSKFCAKCKAFWKRLDADKENHIKELSGLINKHLG